MPTPSKETNLTRPAHTSAQSRKNYYIWLGSQFALIIIIAIALIIEGFIVYHKTLNLLNSSNQYMMDKAGIEASTEINQSGLNLTEEIVEKKQKPPIPPMKTRNIFLFDSFTNVYSTAPESTSVPAVTTTPNTVASSTAEKNL
jgi:hypothetical protein